MALPLRGVRPPRAQDQGPLARLGNESCRPIWIGGEVSRRGASGAVDAVGRKLITASVIGDAEDPPLLPSPGSGQEKL